MDITHRRTIEPLPAHLADDPRLDELAIWGGRLADIGVSPGASGNLSCRTESGFVITATGVPLGEIEPGHWVEVTDIVPLDDGGLEVHSHGLYEPSRDASVHGATYGRTPGAMAVFHLHPDYLEELTVGLGAATTAVFHKAGTVESVREIERFLTEFPDIAYFVLVEHGIVAVGASIEEAGVRVLQYHHAVMKRRG